MIGSDEPRFVSGRFDPCCRLQDLEDIVSKAEDNIQGLLTGKAQFPGATLSLGDLPDIPSLSFSPRTHTRRKRALRWTRMRVETVKDKLHHSSRTGSCTPTRKSPLEERKFYTKSSHSHPREEQDKRVKNREDVWKQLLVFIASCCQARSLKSHWLDFL